MRTLPADSSQSAGGSILDTTDQPTPRDETPFSISRETGAPMADTKTLADATDAMVELGKGEITEDEYHHRIGGEPDAALSGEALVETPEVDVVPEPPVVAEDPNPEAEHPSPDTAASDQVEPAEDTAPSQASVGEADETQATSSGGATVASTDAAPESVAPVEATPPQE